MTHPPCESPLADHVVFVFGCPRSGTTWLVQLLIAHPELAGLDAESLVFNALEDFWANSHRSDGQGVSAYLDAAGVAAARRVFCDHILATARDLHRPGASWFVEKTPDHVFWLPVMAETYPDAWFIHVLRDGRDVARSLAQAPFGPADAAGAAGMWVDAVRQVQLHHWRLPRFQEVRYEDLVDDPVGRSTALLQWLGLTVDDDTVRELEERSALEVSRYRSSEPVGAGKWQRLEPSERAAVHAVAGDTLAELGYLG